MIKLVLIIFIILVIAIFRIVRGIVKTVSNELPFWTEAAGKILNEFLEEENDSGHNPTANLKYRPSFETAFKRQMDQFARFIDQNCKTNLQTFQFLEFCISMHMAKADGVIDSSEIDGIRNYFKETYVEHLDETLLAKASPLVREYIQNYEPDELILSACLTLNVWYDILEDTFPDSEIRDELTMQIFSFVYQVAMMDGVIASSEERFFKGVCEFFKFPTDFQDHIKRTAEYQFNVRKNKANTENKEAKDFENALKLFQLTPNYTKEDLQKAWKNFAKLNHPDRFHNVDRELYEKINAQFLDAKNGYDLLLSKIENPTAKPYYEPSPSAAPSQEEQKQEPPKEEKKETYYSYSKEEFREPSEKVYTEPEKNPFLAYLGNLVSNIQNFVVTKFSPAQLKLIFWGNTKRKMVTIATPIVILLASILIPLLVESHYKKLLESDRVSDYNNAYRYFKVQGEASKDLMKELFRNSNNSILKTNTLHYLLEEKENSSDTHEFILEMLKKEDPIVIKNLEHLNGYYPW
ncbi:MAG TPA: TerB family tellurite resistance protein, partial [Leptospiraceae bacterium]|nr:TerB family tellurite resistance protein [Leptospiraceae bacterium]